MFLKKTVFSHKLRVKRMFIILAAVPVLLLVSVMSILIGTVDFSFEEILSITNAHITNELVNKVIINLRLPRVITGIFVGMNLGTAGVLLQTILRNPMASPNVIGVNSGAGFAAVAVMTVFPHLTSSIPIFAFIGALLATTLIYFLSHVKKNRNTAYIVLAGIAVSNLLNAVTSGMMMLNADILDITYSWLLGSLSGRTWNSVFMVLPYSIFPLTIAILISPKTNLFILGDDMAHSMGLSIRTYRIIIMILASVLAGGAVSVAGTIGFIGLIAPHTARIIIGNDNRFLIPLSALFGAILLVASDTVARTVFQPVELSVGIVTSVLGASFFLWILWRSLKKQQHG